MIAGGGVALRYWDPRTLLGSSTWNNSFIAGNYRDASARRHVVVFSPYKNHIYTPVPSISSPVENRTCSESARCCARCVILYGECQPVFWRTGHGLVVNALCIKAGGGATLRLWDPQSLLGSSTWINSHITGNYPDVSARRHVVMFPPHTNYIYTPVPRVSTPVENRPCSESSARCCSVRLIL